jgi:hypothetical protein
MDKLNYLFKTFSRTKRKDNENYVINALWNQINNLSIKPVSQQYVFSKNKFYYLDLYFPSIMVGVEIDEIGHKNKTSLDDDRTDLIKYALNQEDLKKSKIFRIKTYDTTIEKLHEEITKVAKFIVQKFKTNSQDWLSLDEEIKTFKKKGIVSINDNISFPTINYILNGLFELNKKPGSIRRGSYDLDFENHMIWFPKRSFKQNNEKVDYQGWVNRLSEDRKTIYESNIDTKNTHYLKKDEKVRIVFMKYKDNLGERSYRFLGLFKANGIEQINLNGQRLVSKKYSLINDSMNLSNYKK